MYPDIMDQKLILVDLVDTLHATRSESLDWYKWERLVGQMNLIVPKISNLFQNNTFGVNW